MPSGRSLGGGRLPGILVEGTASPLMPAFNAAIEAVTALLAFALLRRPPQGGT